MSDVRHTMTTEEFAFLVPQIEGNHTAYDLVIPNANVKEGSGGKGDVPCVVGVEGCSQP